MLAPEVLFVAASVLAAPVRPVDCRTNLFVYAPGGYRFTDCVQVGAPLQATFAAVTTLGIPVVFGLGL
ncbi:hypothetical protein BRC97_07900 [Halobacteriales archaeon QS_6_71_20]|nr:MAG: hypothetical protein BRC97_07900 [Halobacteriales archaeon QS_6_71_20]